MNIIKYTHVGLFIFTITTSGVALADCPNTMPVEMQKDCIVEEGAGHGFPTSDYAHMGHYQLWLKTHEPLSIAQPNTVAAS